MKNPLSLPFLIMTALAIGIAAQSLKFVTGNPAYYSPEFAPKYLAHLGTVRAHGIAAIIALTLGPIQFITPLRTRFPRFHRITGRIYFLAIVVASIFGFRMGLMAHGGTLAEIAFCTFAALWLLTAIVALERILRRDIAAHRKWMIRNFALTFGAVTLRIYLNALQAVGFDFHAIYVACAWLGWVPNIIFAELLIAKKLTPWRKRSSPLKLAPLSPITEGNFAE